MNSKEHVDSSLITDSSLNARQSILFQNKQGRFEKLMSANKMLFWEYDVSSKTIYFEGDVSVILETVAEQSSIHIDDFQSRIHREDVEQVDNHWQNYLQHVEQKRQIEYRIRSAKGDYIWVKEIGRAIKLDGQTDKYVISGLIENIHDQKTSNFVFDVFNSLITRGDLETTDKIKKVLNLTARYLDLDLGIVSQVNNDVYTVRYCTDIKGIKENQEFEYSHTYCSLVFGQKEVKNWTNVGTTDIAKHPCYEQGFDAYIGTTLFVEDKPFGTVAFLRKEKRDAAFTQAHINFVRIVSQWIGSEITKHDYVKKLEDSERFLELIQDSIPDLFFVKDKHFRIITANSAFLNLYPPEVRDSVIGTTTLESYDPKEAEEFLYHDKKALETGLSVTEETILFPDGRERTLHTKKIRFYDMHKEPFILAIAHDITQIKLAQSELQRSNLELERFAYATSHDLQEPLRMVANFTQLLKRKYAEQLDDRAKQYIDFARDGALRMQDLVKNVLEYSRVGNEGSQYTEFDFNTLKQSIEDRLYDSITHTQAEINWQDMPVMYTDPVRILSIFQNIVGNAIKYKKTDEKIVVDISCTKEHKQYLFKIRDNGIGMKPQHCERIFEPFKRLHRKDQYAGTGMGLSIVLKAVETLGGSITAESELGKGSCFAFTLPLKP